MQKFLTWLDRLADPERENALALWLDRAAFVFLVLTVVSAPHSIAATQTSWLTGMAIWLVRLFVRPRPKLQKTLLDAAMWGLFAWSFLSSLLSYDPLTSLDKLRGAALFLIFYFVYYNLKGKWAVHFLAFALIGSCMINVLWTPVHRLIGRGVEIHGISTGSPLHKAPMIEGDTILTADGEKVTTPEELLSHVERNEVTQVKFYRPDYELTVPVRGSDLLPGSTALERLGIASWKKSRNWRSSGFYGHYTTYGEVLQLIGSLAFGLALAAWIRRKRAGEDSTTDWKPFTLLLFCLAAISLALLLTVTRASQLSFMISAFVIVLLGAGRKWSLILLAVAVPIGIAGVLFLQQSRDVGFFDLRDESTRYRQIVYGEALHLWTENPRHFVVGVGMDSIKKYAKQWHLFDDGRLPLGHFHSTPLNLLAERGLPALLLWLLVLGVLARSLLLGIRKRPADWRCYGILLGAFGGLTGFFTSGLVHYNLGDAEVVMVFFIIMALAMKAAGHNDAADQ